ncbi:MAG: radical SAM protein [Clostridiaceae bacterium]
MPKHVIIPIFIPHVGCPHDCVFCNQAKITGQLKEEYEKITGTYVRKTIEQYLETVDRGNTTVEVSFFGGTFTAIDLRKQKELLESARIAKEEGLIDYIRLSTRPDYINLTIMNHLKEYTVDIIELGVQSLSQDVLDAAKRGYKKEAVKLASNLIKSFGMTLGHQLMVGLPLDTEEKDMMSLRESLEMKPELVRIYPALVILDTEMEINFREGTYIPYTLDQAVRISANMMKAYEDQGVKVIRIGLQPTDEINSGGDVLGGPFHPAFRELAESYLLSRRIQESGLKKLQVNIGNRDLSKLYADKKRYFKPLLSKQEIKVNVVKDSLKDIIEIVNLNDRSVL